jgi:TatD DNase family protein
VGPLIDTHCHLDVAAFDEDRDAVLARAAAAGVRDVVVPAIRPATWAALAASAGTRAGVRVHVALGIHPQVVPDLDEAERAAVARLPGALAAAGAIAVGECGLDGATADHPGQERLLAAQVAVARELRLPLLVHVLRAHDAAPRVLAEAGAHEVGGIMHSYSGPPELVARYRDLGFAFSFAGPVTWKHARKPVAAAVAVPDELLCAETDAPDQAPEPCRGGRSEPAFLPHVVAGMARARGVSVEAMAALTTANARRVLRLGVD